MAQILLVESDKSTQKILTNLLKTEGYRVASAVDLPKARDVMTKDDLSLVICGIKGAADVEFAAGVVQRRQPPLIALVPPHNPALAKQVSELAPFAVVEKPLKVDRLLSIVQKAVDFGGTTAQQVDLNLQLEKNYIFSNVVAESSSMRSICEMISRVAATDIAVLLTGEKGTGKVAIAKAVHDQSRRKDKPFLVVDCASADVVSSFFGVSGGKSPFEEAAGGTMFLREVTALPGMVQAELARVLQERKLTIGGKSIAVDLRIVTSTTSDLDAMVKQGQFNADLYRHVRMLVIKVPPLRERKEDIMPTIRQVLQKMVGDGRPLPAMSPEVISAFQAYAWPDNVDSIHKVLEVVLKAGSPGKIAVENLPPELRG